MLAATLSLPAHIDDQTGIYQPNPQFMWRSGGGDDVNIALHHTAETFPYRGHSLLLHLSRLTSVLMGAGTVILILLIGRVIFPKNPEIGTFAACLTALNPQFLFISGSINNDNLLILTATGFCFHLLCTLKNPESTQNWLYSSLWISLATLSKVLDSCEMNIFQI
ncbi:glycosyltransferase family 39 protein [Chloroflexi bacterium TSY]|nr:glycosyltransferase family 39 protein [Chloroflexi bacterium TSY]